jgi:hypothetical protein
MPRDGSALAQYRAGLQWAMEDPLNAYLVTVGKLAVGAATADAFMFSAFTKLTGLSPRMANSIYYAVDAIAPRAAMLRRVAEQVCHEDERAIVEGLIDGVRKAHNPRNELAHALISAREIGAPLERISLKFAATEKPRRITDEYLNTLLKTCADGRNAAAAAFEQLCHRRGLPANVEIA